MCRLADHLAGKHIRCPKCSAVVKVVTTLTDSKADLNVAANSNAEVADLYVGRMIDRRGPLSVTQLETLAKWNLINVNELLTDESGSKRSTVREFLDWGGWPERRSAAASRGATIQRLQPLPPEAPAPRPQRLGPKHASRELIRVEPEPEEESTGEEIVPGLSMEEFNHLLSRAVELERTARTVHRVTDYDGHGMPGYVPTAGARLIRRRYFAEGLNSLAIVLMVNAVVFGICLHADLGIFIKRLLELTSSIFIPFGTTAEVLEGEPLMLAGTALVFFGAQMVIPIFVLYWNDCIWWHSAGATFFGLFIGMAMRPEWVPGVMMVARVVAAVCGLATCWIAWWITRRERKGEITARFVVAILVTIAAVAGMSLLDSRQVLVASVEQLSPSVSGTGLHAAVFLISFFAIVTAVPLVMFSFIHPEVPETVQQFMNTKFIIGILLVGFGAFGVSFLVFPPSSAFVNVPTAMLSFAIANTLAVTTPPMLWLLDPAYSLARS